MWHIWVLVSMIRPQNIQELAFASISTNVCVCVQTCVFKDRNIGDVLLSESAAVPLCLRISGPFGAPPSFPCCMYVCIHVCIHARMHPKYQAMISFVSDRWMQGKWFKLEVLQAKRTPVAPAMCGCMIPIHTHVSQQFCVKMHKHVQAHVDVCI